MASVIVPCSATLLYFISNVAIREREDSILKKLNESILKKFNFIPIFISVLLIFFRYLKTEKSEAIFLDIFNNALLALSAYILAFYSPIMPYNRIFY